MLQIISKLVVPKLLPWNKKMQIIFNNNISIEKRFFAHFFRLKIVS